MTPGRILIVAKTKENGFELRDLLDELRCEVEIALSASVGRAILDSRRMDLIVLHTEAVSAELVELFEYLDVRELDIPMILCGEEAKSLAERVPHPGPVECFDRPYAANRMVQFVKNR